LNNSKIQRRFPRKLAVDIQFTDVYYRTRVWSLQQLKPCEYGLACSVFFSVYPGSAMLWPHHGDCPRWSKAIPVTGRGGPYVCFLWGMNIIKI
jgi:hypothetical protein